MISVVALALLQLAMPVRSAVTRASGDSKVAAATTDSPKLATGNVASNIASNIASYINGGTVSVASAAAGAPDAKQADQADQAADATDAGPTAPVESAEAASTEVASTETVADSSTSTTTAMIVRPLLAGDATSAPGSSAAAEAFSSSLSPVPAPIISAVQQADDLRNWQAHQKRIWLALSIAQSSAATFDAYSTRMVVGSGGGYELNPMLRPFAGNASMYLAVQAGPVLIDYVSRRMLESHYSWMRRGWWIPQVTGTVVSLVSGARNMALYGAGQ